MNAKTTSLLLGPDLLGRASALAATSPAESRHSVLVRAVAIGLRVLEGARDHAPVVLLEPAPGGCVYAATRAP